ncbi:5-hydroxytryptamine receptor 3A-like [Lycodopsis pacificus]
MGIIIFRAILHTEVEKKMGVFVSQDTEDDSPQNPYVSYDGTVTSEEEMKVVSTFEEIRLLPSSNASRAIKFSRDVIKTQGEWEFLHLTVTHGVYSERHCSYQDVMNHLNLTQNNELYSMTRPVKNYKRPTLVSLEVVLYAILDVVEKDQKFIPYVWTVMRWHNEYISWDPNEFCGIDNISLPAEILWKPDLTIEEMTEKDKAPPSPYLTINNKGVVEVHNDQVLVSTCRMHIYKFPFDIQRCNLSFKSVVHTVRDIRLQPSDNSSEATEWSRELMRTQYEWLFINMTVTANASDMVGHDMIIYTVRIARLFQAAFPRCVKVATSEPSGTNIFSQITMKRRSILYIVNFLTPVLFFLCLDLASFLISDSGGEKLSFKVTVLLAVTVLQLILNEILPATSNRIPLIALYCIGIFALMLLSLLETILVMHLMEKDSQAAKDIKADEGRSRSEGGNKRGKANFQNSHGEVQEWTRCACIYDGSTGETPSELLPVAKEGNSNKLIEEYHALEKLSDELREMEKTLSLLLNNRKEEEKPGYWTRVAKKSI